MASPSDSKSQSILPTSQAHPFNVNPGPQMYVVQGTELYQPARKRPSALRRVLRGLVFVFVFLALCKWIFPRKFSWLKRGEVDFDIHHNDWHYEIPSDLLVDNCVQGNDWAKDEDDGIKFFHTARTSFDLPLSADNLFLLSRGWLSAGLVELVTSPDQAADSVTVKVVAEYHREHIRSLAKACLVSRDGNQQGVGVFTPTWESGRRPHEREDSMHFFTTIVFPDFSDNESAAPVKGFETDVPNTSQYVKHLKSKINFDSISLKSSNANIYVESLAATRASLRTSNAPITGSFNTTTSLSLKTSNNRIHVDVGLLSDSTEPTFVARTSNGNIDARLRLSSSAGSGGKFDVSTITSNSPVFVAFTDAPLGSTLSLEAKTSNGRAHVSLHPTYEGDFDIETSAWFKAELNLLPGADPSGNNRHRGTVVQEQKKSHLFGSTSWVEEGRSDTPAGEVNIHTSNAAVVLDVLGN